MAEKQWSGQATCRVVMCEIGPSTIETRMISVASGNCDVSG